MFLQYLTLHKNWNATLTSWSIDTWNRILEGNIAKATDEWQTRPRACVKEKGCHFEHLLWSSHTTGSFQTLTCQIGSFQNHSHYWEEYNINFRFLCNVRYVTTMPHAKCHCNKLATIKYIQDYANLSFGTQCRNVLIRAWIVRRRRPAV